MPPLSAASSSNWNQWKGTTLATSSRMRVDHRLDLRHAADHPLAGAAHAVEVTEALDVGGAQTGESRRLDGEQGDGGDQGQGQAPAATPPTASPAAATGTPAIHASASTSSEPASGRRGSRRRSAVRVGISRSATRSPLRNAARRPPRSSMRPRRETAR